MENNLIKINPETYGIKESKAQELEIIFAPFIEILKQIEIKRDNLLNKEITKELCIEAHSVQMEAVKFRTGIEKVHKIAKEESRKTGLAIDGWKNLLLNASEPIEIEAKNIKNHFENFEKERIANLQKKRSELCSQFEFDGSFAQLGMMSDEVWNNFYAGIKLAYENKKEVERKAEEKRIAKEKAEEEERERIRLENIQLKAEAEEKERLAEIERKKQAKILADQKAKAIAEQNKLKAEAEKKLQKEREEKAELQAKIDADNKLKREAETKRIKEEEAKKLAERKSQLAPDKEKLKSWALKIGNMELPTVTSKEAIEIMNNANDSLIEISEFINLNAKKL